MKKNIEHIPQELIELDQWVSWNGINKQNGKISKMPINPQTGKAAKTNDSTTWGTFNEASAYCEKNNLNGIGFVFSAEDPFFGVDLDDCLDPVTGEISPWANDIIDNLNSYTEITPSSKGLHILAKGALPGKGKKIGNLEIYDQGRFFTVTGNHLPESPTQTKSRQSQITKLYNKSTTPPSIETQSSCLLLQHETEIIDRASQSDNSDKFMQLWRGETDGYPSNSEADLALCRMLSYWANNDLELVDSIFKKSKLFRPKWDKVIHSDGSTYGQQTLEIAVVGKKNSLLEPTGSHHQGKPFNLSDLGNAERLVDIHGEDIRYCHAWREWLIWDGSRWGHDRTKQINTKAKLTVRSIYNEASQAKDSGERTAISKHAQKSEGGARIGALVNLAQSDPDISVTPEELDQDHWRLTCLNSTIDLKSGEPCQHNRNHMISQLAPVAYDPYAACPVWEAFLDRIMNGNQNLISFLQRAIGYSLTGDTSEQCLFIFYGSGANGKSTFLQAISTMLGDYAMQTPTETLLVRRKGAIPNDVARLKGARLVTASEAEADQKLAEGLIKQMTGQDTLSARFLHQEWFDFKPTHKIFLATNHKPVIHGTDIAIWRRIKLVPFEVTIPEQERDRQLLSKLEAELPGIFSWAVKGCLDWVENGIGEPIEVRAATDDYKCEMDVMVQFLSDCCIIDTNASVQSKELYAAYEHWCSEVGEEPVKQRTFGMKLKEKGFKSDRMKGSRCWKGLTLQPLPQLDTLTHDDTTNHVLTNKSVHVEETYNLVSHASHASKTPLSSLCLQGGEGVQ